jgi:acyl dehydratase
MLTFNVVFGMTVQDLSEAGGAFLGIDDLSFHETVEPGDTIYAESEVVEARESDSRPHQGIVTWHTEGRNSDDELVVEYNRTNLINKRNPPEDD